MRKRGLLALALMVLAIGLMICQSALAECDLRWVVEQTRHRQKCLGCETHTTPKYVGQWGDHSLYLEGCTWPDQVQPTNGAMPYYVTITWDVNNMRLKCRVCSLNDQHRPSSSTERAYLYSEKTKPATCTSGGTYVYRNGGLTSSDSKSYLYGQIVYVEKSYTVGALGHDWSNKDGVCARIGCGEKCTHEEAAKRLTCEMGAECGVCGATLAPLGHIFNYVSNGDAKCEQDGTKTAHCERAGCKAEDTQDDVGSALKHSFANYVSNGDAKCEQDGTKTAHCEHAGCDAVDTQDDVGSALKHSFANYVSNGDAKCEEDGTKTAHCDRAGCDAEDTQDDAGSALKHSFTNYVSNGDAKCEEDGTKTAHCDRAGCNATDTQSNVGSALKHDVQKDAAVDATCTEAGLTEGAHCARCGKVLTAQQPIAALGHDLKRKTVEPTCEKGGYTDEICTRCEERTRVSSSKKLDHWFAEWTHNDGADTHSAACRRCEQLTAVVCQPFETILALSEQNEPLKKAEICPVCGLVNDGTCLELAENIQAEAVNGALPAGEVVLRLGELESGDVLMSVGFEYGGTLTQPLVSVRFTLDRDALEGYTLSLIGEDGIETPLNVEADDDTVSFMLDFTPVEGETLQPARFIRLTEEA